MALYEAYVEAVEGALPTQGDDDDEGRSRSASSSTTTTARDRRASSSSASASSSQFFPHRQQRFSVTSSLSGRHWTISEEASDGGAVPLRSGRLSSTTDPTQRSARALSSAAAAVSSSPVAAARPSSLSSPVRPRGALGDGGDGVEKEQEEERCVGCWLV